jgi:glycosyltransferase involved in cell wall biosynthesis
MFSHIDSTTVFIIIPAFNEHESLGNVVDELINKHYSLVVVDDGSDIDLFPLLKNKPAFLLRHKINLGQGASIQTGIDFAISKQASYIVTFDADGQHNADDIAKMLDALVETKSDIALGSRFIEKSNSIPVRRKILLQLARYINYLFTGLFLTDAHNGLRVMTAETATKIRIKENRMAHATEILSLIRKEKMKYVEVPVAIYYTEYSRTKGQTATSGFRILFDLLLNKIFR